MPITNGYSTLASYKRRAGIESIDAADDTFIEDCIEAASRFIDAQTGRTFYARTETHYYDTPSRGVRFLFTMDDDLLTVSSLINGNASTITSGQYKVYPLNTSPRFEIRLLGSVD